MSVLPQQIQRLIPSLKSKTEEVSNTSSEIISNLTKIKVFAVLYRGAEPF